MRLLLTAVLLAGPCAAAQTYTVSGHVVDAVTGRPLARATVSLAPLSSANMVRDAPDTQAALMTGADGAFTFQNLPQGKYQLTGSRRGYRTSLYLARNQFFAACVLGPDKPELHHLRLALTPNASLHGTVLDASGDPVEQAQVTVFGLNEDGSGQMRQWASTRVQEGDSEYDLPDLPPGKYYLAVTARPWFAAQGSAANLRDNPLDVVYPLTFSGGATEQAQAQPILLRAGEAATANLTLTAIPALHLAIPVPTPSRTGAVPGGYFPQVDLPAFGEFLTVPQGAMLASPGQDGTLTWSFSVAPGSYRISRDGVSEQVQVKGDTPVELVEGPNPVRVSGRLAMADGSSLPPGLTLHLVPVNGTRVVHHSGLRPSQEISARLGGNGEFQLEAVTPGEYQVAVDGKTAAAFIDAAADGALFDSGVLKVGQQAVILAATLASADTTASGYAASAAGRPEAGVMVVLAPEDFHAAALYREDETNSDGSWGFDDVAAGRYQAVAIRDGWDLAWKQPAVLAKYLRAGGVSIVVDGRSPMKLEQPLRVQDR